jgi:multiple sugar transport system substrate-binding protein
VGVRGTLLAALRRRSTVAATALAVATAAIATACGGGGDKNDKTTDAERTNATISVWILEDEPDRVRATKRDLVGFTKKTGINIRLRALNEDDLAAAVTSARADRTLPDAIQLPLASVHAYAADGLLDSAAAGDVLDRLGDETFSQTALSLVSRDGIPAAVPSDGWGELLIYRKDLFAKAHLPRPQTLEDVENAAKRLDVPGHRAGITLATAPGEAFTAQTFEHVALAAGCQVVDDQGRVRLTSPACERAFRLYVDLARRYAPPGIQDVETTRKAYFAGRAAMIFWSPFLLDAMAGLRGDAVPTCPQCRKDPAFLAKNSGLVGALGSDDASTPAAQFGELSSWGITTGANTDGARRFVEYMLSDGYLAWLALSPQGKYPVRTGDDSDPERFATAWMHLRSGVERKAPLQRFYGQASIDSLGDGVRSFQRWGFQQGEAALMGALRNQEPITRPLALAIVGAIDPPTAARQAQLEVEAVRAGTR